MYIEGEIDWKVAPSLVMDYFPNPKKHTATQIHVIVKNIRNNASISWRS
jgi:hypothetical protein